MAPPQGQENSQTIIFHISEVYIRQTDDSPGLTKSQLH